MVTPPPPSGKLGRDAIAELLCEFARLLHRANSRYSWRKVEGTGLRRLPALGMLVPSRGVLPPRLLLQALIASLPAFRRVEPWV
jgi:hypothetical protein